MSGEWADRQHGAIIIKPLPGFDSRLPIGCRAGWQSTYALANFYRDGQECVGAHAGANSPSRLRFAEHESPCTDIRAHMLTDSAR